MFAKKRTQKERRSSARRPVQWIGHYGTPGTPATGWSPCAIGNISSHGALTTVYGGGPVESGQPIEIDVERIGPTTVGFRLHGVVRHVDEADADGLTSFGVELTFETVQDRRTAEMLFRP
jgi:hypothetical protein